jgi:hypothetical protein
LTPPWSRATSQCIAQEVLLRVLNLIILVTQTFVKEGASRETNEVTTSVKEGAGSEAKTQSRQNWSQTRGFRGHLWVVWGSDRDRFETDVAEKQILYASRLRMILLHRVYFLAHFCPVIFI